MLKNLRKRTEGFTIIEVLIVLAIAGLIMIIVFLAVPSLQRSSRNNQIRNDANIILGYINEYAANNNGALPQGVCTVLTDPTKAGNVYMSVDATCDGGASDKVGGKIRPNVEVTSPSSPANPADTQKLIVGLNRKCDSVTKTITSTPSNRAFSVGFKVETAGGSDDQCVES